jgi:hypothetical protein
MQCLLHLHEQKPSLMVEVEKLLFADLSLFFMEIS